MSGAARDSKSKPGRQREDFAEPEVEPVEVAIQGETEQRRKTSTDDEAAGPEQAAKVLKETAEYTRGLLARG